VTDVDIAVAVIGGGQAGLATAHHLRRRGVADRDVVVLDASPGAGGAWPQVWPSLRLFSPAELSSLPGRLMPPWTRDDGYPPASHVAAYLSDYEDRYALQVRHGERVSAVHDDGAGRLLVESGSTTWRAQAVVSATGTWGRPFVPRYPGAEDFTGRQLHTVGYDGPASFTGQRVLVVGGGNSGAQVVADLALSTRTTWVTQRPPRFLPDDVDGRVLFDVATARRQALDAGRPDTGGVGGLGDVVVVPAVRAARAAGLLAARRPFSHLTSTGVVWPDGRTEDVDAVIWCTGFRPDLGHLAPLGLRRGDGTVPTIGTRAVADARVHLVGYGDWTGPASATLIGVGRTARAAADELVGDVLGRRPARMRS
jgi:putative flavoprotein involved in K+ transport